MCMAAVDPFDMTVMRMWHTQKKGGFSKSAVLANASFKK